MLSVLILEAIWVGLQAHLCSLTLLTVNLQVDLAPLMAALLGVPVPMNSVGSLPIELLDASPKYLFQSSYANLKQVRIFSIGDGVLKTVYSNHK